MLVDFLENYRLVMQNTSFGIQLLTEENLCQILVQIVLIDIIMNKEGDAFKKREQNYDLRIIVSL